MGTGALTWLRAHGLEDQLVWIVASPRSGTTWLLNLLGLLTRGTKVDEPLIGAHLAVPTGAVSGLPNARYRTILEASASRDDYVFSDSAADVWQPALRSLILRRFAFAAIMQRADRRAPVFVKEPNGSLAAPILLRTLPRSRVLFLVRDGRDVIDSVVDGVSGGWTSESLGVILEPDQRRQFLEVRAHQWVQTVQAVQRAYGAHAPERRMRVRYEDLRSDTEGQVARILDWLGADVLQRALAEGVDLMSFERVPEDARGPGRFVRTASPGLWRSNFSEEDQRIITAIMGPTLRSLGYT